MCITSLYSLVLKLANLSVILELFEGLSKSTGLLNQKYFNILPGAVEPDVLKLHLGEFIPWVNLEESCRKRTNFSGVLIANKIVLQILHLRFVEPVRKNTN